METLAPLLTLGIIILFGILVVFLIRMEKAEKSRKSQQALNIGFTPIEPDQSLLVRISQLYQTKKGITSFELRNVSHKGIPDGEMYLFDLVNTSGEEDSVVEEQAVAVFSQYLDLPEFTIFPQLDIKGTGGRIVKSLLSWVVSKAGDPVDFSDHPRFQQRYLVSSGDSQETRNFLDDRKLHLLAKVRLLCIHAGGDIFVLSTFDQAVNPRNNESISKRISKALDVYQIFTG